MISIVMPCYNCEASLVRTAECIRAQTVADWELIAVDDGSSDGTVKKEKTAISTPIHW